MNVYEQIDKLYLQDAARIQRLSDSIQCVGITPTWQECINVIADTGWTGQQAGGGTAETSLLTSATAVELPWIPALYMDSRQGNKRGFTFGGRGIFSNTSTPTLTLRMYLMTSPALATISTTGGSIVLGVTPAITTITTVTAVPFFFDMSVIVTTPGLGTGASTVQAMGQVWSPGGFASPFYYGWQPVAPPSASITTTCDSSVTNYIGVSCQWGSNSASNLITLKALYGFAWN